MEHVEKTVIGYVCDKALGNRHLVTEQIKEGWVKNELNHDKLLTNFQNERKERMDRDKLTKLLAGRSEKD